MNNLNIREILMKFSESNMLETKKIISTVLIEELDKGNRPKLNEIAKKANISKSSIVKFCQKLGFNGYLDFINALLKEQEYSYQPKKFIAKQIKQLKDEFNLKIFNEMNFISEYLNEFEWFASNIKNYKQIFILGSEENILLCNMLNDYLTTLNLNSKFSNFRAQWIYPNFFNDDTLIVLIVSGMNNQKIETFYKAAVKAKSEIFLITTESQNIKFIEVNHRIILRYLDFFPWHQSRILIFMYVINLLFYFINHYYSEYYLLMYDAKIKY